VRYSLRKKVWILNAICTITRFLIFLLYWPWFNYFVLNNFLKHNSWNPYVIQAIRVSVLRNIEPLAGVCTSDTTRLHILYVLLIGCGTYFMSQSPPVVTFFHLFVHFSSSFVDRFAIFLQFRLSFIRDEARVSCFHHERLNFHKFFFVLRDFIFTYLIGK
jgi:hypothetical protein